MNLTNGEILGAAVALRDIREEKLPVKVSMNLAQLALKLDEPIKAFEEVKSGLTKTYEITQEQEKDKDGKVLEDEKGNIRTILKAKKPEILQKFLDEMNELLLLEVEVVVTKVKLPEKIAGTCDKCNHNMDVPLQLTQGTLIALAKLVEV